MEEREREGEKQGGVLVREFDEDEDEDKKERR